MDKLTHGHPAHLPWEYEHIVLAARFGLDPDVVAEWPADKYAAASALFPVLVLVGFPASE